VRVWTEFSGVRVGFQWWTFVNKKRNVGFHRNTNFHEKFPRIALQHRIAMYQDKNVNIRGIP